MTPCTILYAEDEPDDIFFLKRAFEQLDLAHQLKSVADGRQAVEYLAGEGRFADRKRHPLPTLVLLDINMPKKSGLEVLGWLRGQRHFKSLPVVILTSSSRTEDRDEARRLGADDYLLKPSDPSKLVEMAKSLENRWLAQPAREDNA